MFKFLLGVLILASNFLVVSWASAGTDAGSGPGVRTVPVRGRARWAAFTLALGLLLPAAANAQNAYIPLVGDSAVSVINTVTNTVVATVPVGNNPFGVTVTPDGTKVYVANQRDSTVSVIDTASNIVIATIFQNRDHRPLGVAVTPDGTKVYIANTIDVGQSRSVSVISTASNTVIAEITVGIGTGMAVTPDGTKVYGADGISAVSVIATATDTVVGASIPVGDVPSGVAITPDGAKVYVANRDSGTVSMIATASNTVTAAIPVGTQPQGVAVTPDGTKVYIANNASGTVSVIATASDAVLDTIPVGGAPFGVAVTPDGAKVYVANDAIAGTVLVIDTASNTVVATIPVGNQPAAFGKFIGGPLHGSPPVAVNESATITANTPVGIDLTKGASGNPTSAALVGTPAGGTVTGFPATTVTFTPTTGFTGAASFQFTLANANGTSNTATATITVTPPPPPVAVPETASTTAGTPVTIDLSTGASGNPTSAAIVSGPTHGVLKFVSNTMVRYKLTACFLGPDSFTFTLANAYGTSNVATATITITAVSAPTIAVHLVDPFLLGANLSNIDLTPLYHAQNWADVQANGLSADGVSAAIAVIQTNDCANDVTLTTTNGTTLLPFLHNENFLTTAPAAGSQSLPIPVANLDRAGPFFYGAALVQAPVGAPAPSFTAPIFVTAQQGSQTAQAQAELVPPPVVLVHGIWGDKHSLGGKDRLAHYLKTTPPWLNHPHLVQVLCYSKYFGFDAPIDPLSAGSIDPCEYTSRDAIASTISGLLSTLDSLKIVGSRVDVVAHSMGGLAARYYASKKKSYYGLLRNRTKGQFRKVITLDTPELGSQLAHFLDKHSSCIGDTSHFLWRFACGRDPLTTVAQCFAGLDYPLAAPGYDLNLGAVYSLYPNGPALQNPNLSGPNIAGANWHAVSAIAPGNSALEYVLNGLIAAIYPQDIGTCHLPTGSPHTIDDILKDKDPMKDSRNDAIVPLYSQLAGVQPHHSTTFPDLSHSGLPPLVAAILGLVPGLSDANVPESRDVWQWVCKWLSPIATCPAALPASATQVSASKVSPANKNAVPMPQIVVAHPHSVDRLTLSVPAGLELGKPFDLAVNTGSGGLPELHIVQSSETGTQMEVPATISRVEGQTVYLSVTPTFYGATRFQVSAAYRDGGVAFKEVAANINLPSWLPAQFHADTFAVTAIRFDLDNPSLRLQPWAIYANIPERVYLDARYVSYSIAPGVGPPAVSLDPNGVVHGLRTGTATIIARFGSLTDQVRVNVEAEQR